MLEPEVVQVIALASELHVAVYWMKKFAYVTALSGIFITAHLLEYVLIAMYLLSIELTRIPSADILPEFKIGIIYL